MSALIAVERALQIVLSSAETVLPAEPVDLRNALGRTLAEDLAAQRPQPPFNASAMDGYAARAADLANTPHLRVIGRSRAGCGFSGRVEPGECVRIFTGAPVPEGADTVFLQENTRAQGAHVTVLKGEPAGRYIRRKGRDFIAGERLLAAGRRLGANELALAAAMNHAVVPVVREPRVALLSIGDELVKPGETPNADQIITSNNYAVAAIARDAGGVALDLGIVPDEPRQLRQKVEAARGRGADVLVTLGGASVGDHDLTQQALVDVGMQMAFWKIAMRPGKPLMHGQIGAMRVLGLPGNPVSAIVCALLFLRPLIRALLGDPSAAADRSESARLGRDLAANDARQDYLRAELSRDANDQLVASAFADQDSSLLKILAGAQCLIIRPPFAPAAVAGSQCRIIKLSAVSRPFAD
jgi:molybdopterin molybdotransferase